MRSLALLFLVFLMSCGTDTTVPGIPNYAELQKLDKKLGKPQPGEWLYSHHEKHQSFDAYIKRRPVQADKIRNVIVFQPIGNFTSEEQMVIANTVEYVQLFYGLKVRLNPSIPDITVKGRRMNDGGLQYHTKFVLDSLLLPEIPDDAIVCYALTATDLYPSEDWNYVFGQAYTGKRVGVGSMARFEGYAGVDSVWMNKCLELFMKTTCHEIGHMFSIQHCTNAHCLMNGCNHIDEMDAAPNLPCSECHAKLYWNLHFDPLKRMRSLHQFYSKYGMERDSKLSQQQVSVMTESTR